MADEECIQIDLAMPSEAPEQSFGAHRDHLERLLHAGFHIEVPFPAGYEEDLGSPAPGCEAGAPPL
ncbi:hypothetical protein [Microbacterium sp. MMO-10]|uniref:hypothetical protein n=1 Tax=Microbacterium sp. MMO-10 TaxID=3081272 RepID=UPI0030158B28